jgi:hypothetical protein
MRIVDFGACAVPSGGHGMPWPYGAVNVSTRGQAGAQTFDPARLDPRMNRPAGRFTSGAPADDHDGVGRVEENEGGFRG